MSILSDIWHLEEIDLNSEGWDNVRHQIANEVGSDISSNSVSSLIIIQFS